MLVLGRKTNESIQVGDDVKVTVIKVGKDRVQIGIEAPSSKRILRCELVSKLEQSPAVDLDLPAFLSDSHVGAL